MARGRSAVGSAADGPPSAGHGDLRPGRLVSGGAAAGRGYEVVGLVRGGVRAPNLDGVRGDFTSSTATCWTPALAEAAPIARRPPRRALPPRRADLRPRLVGGPDRDRGRDRRRRPRRCWRRRSRPTRRPRVWVSTLERGLRRRAGEPAGRGHPDAPAHALRRGEARRARPRARDARAPRALRVQRHHLQPRVAAPPAALPPAQGHARGRRDRARAARASSCSATSTRCATGRTRATSCAARGSRSGADEPGDYVFAAGVGHTVRDLVARRVRRRRRRGRAGAVRARRPGVRAPARAGRAGRATRRARAALGWVPEISFERRSPRWWPPTWRSCGATA